MADENLRHLERKLKLDPTDFQTRQQLLSAYLRSGRLTDKSLAELAALGDFAATLLRGERPKTYNSLTRQFYLRCGLAAVDEAYWRWDPGLLAQIANRADRSHRDVIDNINEVLDLMIDSFETFRKMLIANLTKQAIEELPRIKFYQVGSNQLAEFWYVFKELKVRLGYVDVFQPEYPVVAYLLELLDAFYNLAYAIQHPVKKYGDYAIHCACRAINYLNRPPYPHHEENTGDMMFSDFFEELKPQIVELMLPEYTTGEFLAG